MNPKGLRKRNGRLFQHNHPTEWNRREERKKRFEFWGVECGGLSKTVIEGGFEKIDGIPEPTRIAFNLQESRSMP